MKDYDDVLRILVYDLQRIECELCLICKKTKRIDMEH